MKGRRIYYILTAFIAFFILANMLAPDQPGLEGIVEQDAAVVSQFEEDLQVRLKNDFGSAGSLRDLAQTRPGLAASLALFVGLAMLSVPAGAVGLALYLIVKARGAEWIRRVQNLPAAGWPVYDILRVAILFTFVACCLILVEGVLVGGGLVSKQSLTRGVPIFNTLFLDLWAGFLILSFVRLRQSGSPFRALGLVRRSLPANITLGGIAYVCIIPIFAIALVTVIWLSNWAGYEPPTHPLVTVFVASESRLTFLVALFLGIGVGPVVEEIFFRGFCYSALRRRLGIWPAVLASSLLFSLVHWNPFSALPIFCLGAALAYLYEKTGSLVASITMHSLHNGLLIVGLFLTKGIVVT